MIVEMFDKCSELDEYYKKHYTYRNMSASEETLNTCDKLTELSNEHDNHLKMINGTSNGTSVVNTEFNFSDWMNFDGIGNLNNVNIMFNNVPGLPIYLLIILAIITTIFIAIPLVPVIMSGSIIFVLFSIVFIIIIMFGIYLTFK
jgi:hypothetical protein